MVVLLSRSISRARALMRVVLLRLIKIFIRGYDSLSLSRSFACACARVAVDKLICYRLRARRGLRASAYVFSLSFSLVIIQALRVPVRVDFSFAQNAKLLEEELILLFEFLRGGRQRRDGGFCGFGASENLSSFGFEKF